jgi:hypothetical protein
VRGPNDGKPGLSYWSSPRRAPLARLERIFRLDRFVRFRSGSVAERNLHPRLRPIIRRGQVTGATSTLRIATAPAGAAPNVKLDMIDSCGPGRPGPVLTRTASSRYPARAIMPCPEKERPRSSRATGRPHNRSGE